MCEGSVPDTVRRFMGQRRGTNWGVDELTKDTERSKRASNKLRNRRFPTLHRVFRNEDGGKSLAAAWVKQPQQRQFHHDAGLRWLWANLFTLGEDLQMNEVAHRSCSYDSAHAPFVSFPNPQTWCKNFFSAVHLSSQHNFEYFVHLFWTQEVSTEQSSKRYVKCRSTKRKPQRKKALPFPRGDF